MSLVHILSFALAATAYRFLGRGRGREWFILVASVAALYWLQPASPIRHMDFWLPTASLALAVWVWAATRPRAASTWREPAATLVVCGAVVLAITLPGWLGLASSLTPSRPPSTTSALLGLAALAAVLAILALLPGRVTLAAMSGLILILFLTLKAEPLTIGAGAALRTWTGQSPDLASPLDLRWLGFSYLAFRLLHALRDRMLGRLPDLTLRQFLTYALFFPAVASGPIDRLERFSADLRSPLDLSADRTAEAGWRILLGLVKKYALADALGVFALNAVNAAQTTATAWLWVLLYAFALQLYLDFSGYTDVAIGLGLLLGVRLPENFRQPYLQPNLTAFWNSWHITLAQWFRAYYFNPLARSLRRAHPQLPTGLAVLLAQVSTMVLIGLWHGIRWNFLIWGTWHGLGLFLHNRWSEWMRRQRWDQALTVGWRGKVVAAAGVLATFHFVTLGWVWFALPDPALAASVLARLFGI